jgi:hypothetical protein
MDQAACFWGYDISPQAIKMCESRENEKLQFKLANITLSQRHCLLKLRLETSPLGRFKLSIQSNANQNPNS